MDKKDTENCKEVTNRFVVMGIRHFENGEHHWIAHNVSIDALAFAEEGKVEANDYYKPVFTSLADAERFAMSIVHGEYALAQWETRRPTMYIVEEETYIAIVEKDSYSLPKEAEEWSDAKMADFERECDCEDIANLAVWDSETDDERFTEAAMLVARELNSISGMRAWITPEGLVGVEDKENTTDGVRDFVDNMNRLGELGCEDVEFSHTDGESVYFEVK